MQGFLRFFAAGTVLYEFNNWFTFAHNQEYVNLIVTGVFGCTGTDIVSNPYQDSPGACSGFSGFLPLVQLYLNHIGEVLMLVAGLAIILFGGAWLWRHRLRGILRHSRKSVEGQMAHGNARLATEAETAAAAAGAVRRSNVHDQEF